jgi:hypothetical protein
MSKLTRWPVGFSERRRRCRRKVRPTRYSPHFEQLESRLTPSLPGAGGDFNPTGTITTDTPTFTWPLVWGADHYDIWVSDQTTGQSPVVRLPNEPNFAVTLTRDQALTPGDSYLWWSGAVGPRGTDWRDAQSFTIAALAPPLPSGPTGTITSTTPTFSWSAVPEADHYYFWLSDETTGQSPVLFVPNVSLTSFSVASAQQLTPGHSYVWWAGAVSTNGRGITWSSPQSLTIAPLAAPVAVDPVGTITTATPTFDWSSVAGADHYYLWVNDQTTGQGQVLNVPQVTGTSFTVAAAQQLTPGHSYMWWAGAVSGNGQGITWSSGQSLTIAPLAAPVAADPVGTIVAATPTFDWSPVAGADHYYLWVNDQTTGQGQVLNVPHVTGTSFTVTAAEALAPGHSYMWWAGAVSGNGQGITWSTPQTFHVAANWPTPGDPTGTINTATPTFTWSSVPAVSYYDLWVDDLTTGQSQVVHNSSLPGTTMTLSTALALTPGDSYAWWAGAMASNGTTNWSGAQYFTVAALAPPTPAGPSGVIGMSMPTFAWSPVAGADHYDLWVNDLTSGQNQVVRVPYVVSTSWALSAAQALQPDHNYTWWVGAVSANGRATTWSSAQNLRFTVAPPSVILAGPDFTTLRDNKFLTVQVTSFLPILPTIHIDADLKGDGSFTDKGDVDVITFDAFPGTNTYQLSTASNVPTGTYALRARVSDTLGHTGFSPPVTIQVDPNAGFVGDRWLLGLLQDFTNPSGFNNGAGEIAVGPTDGGGFAPGPGAPTPPSGSPPATGGQGSDTLGLNGQGPTQQTVVAFYSKLLEIDSKNRVLVDIRATLNKYVDSLEQDLKKLGMNVIGVYSAQNLIQGYLPIQGIQALSQLANFNDAVAVLRPHLDRGQVPIEGNAPIKADSFTNTTGATGQGIKVGILSDSVGQVGGGISDSQAVGALPAAGVQVLEDGPAGYSDEGRAMLETVYNVAPGASLAFHTGTVSPQDMAAGVAALQQAGAQVIADDLEWPQDPMFNDGLMSQAVENAVANGAVYAVSASNDSNQGYLTAWKGVSGSIDGGKYSGTFLDVGGGKILQPFTMPPNGFLSIPIQWDSAFLEGGSPLPNYQVKNEVDVYVTDPTGATVYATFNNNTLNTNEALQLGIWFNTQTTSQFALSYRLAQGPAPTMIRWRNFDSNDPQAAGEGAPCMFGHHAAAGALTIGAVPWYAPKAPEPSSGVGGNLQILFDSSGNRLATPEVRVKPDFVAPDGLDTSFYGSSPGGDPDGDSFNDFFGTSAATAEVAGAAALYRSFFNAQNTPATPSQIDQVFAETALTIGTPGHDPVSGGGLIQVVPVALPGSGIALTGQDNHNHTSDTALELGTLAGPFTLGNQSIVLTPGVPDANWYALTAGTSGSLAVTVADIATMHGGDLHQRVFRLDPGNVMTELGGSQLVGGYKTQSTVIDVTAGERYLIWVYGFNFEQGNYTLQLNLS